ncbi:hypothetical protein JZO76_00135 [Enterococcus sp. MJM12]|uniref:Uncharacterized protein n=1 Tax=Candidatus Enterococcus myersii TaxID=2815322 RepID=A0ABS3H398_9ENTE|nr:hypothetical protein [Enterococcus sp. MJM12]MBO0447936.1 hypothetical protein [Enterococcus sp. MJM12]
MEYEDLKDYVSNQLPKKSRLVVMKKVIDEMAEYFSMLKNKLTVDLAIDDIQNNINVATTGGHTGTFFSIGDRSLSANYDGDKTIEVTAYEPGVLPASKVDTIVFRDGKAIHELTGEQFDIKNVEKYLDWFKK